MGDNGTRKSVGTIETRPMRRVEMENPFAFKVLQVFTGFGIGCGVGIGVGQPINLGAVPMVGQVMSAASGATYAVSGFSGHVNRALRKVGAKNVQAGIGCGVGFGHGFGLVGFAVRPSVIQKLQATLLVLANKLMTKVGTLSNPSSQDNHPIVSSGGMSILDKPSLQIPLNSVSQVPVNELLVGNPSHHTGVETATSKLHNAQFGSQTEKVLASFMQNSIIKEGFNDVTSLANQLRSENNVLQMVIKHQQIIAQLMEENEKLRQILIEDLNVPPRKLENSYSTPRRSFICSDCIECRRKQRRR